MSPKMFFHIPFLVSSVVIVLLSIDVGKNLIECRAQKWYHDISGKKINNEGGSTDDYLSMGRVSADSSIKFDNNNRMQNTKGSSICMIAPYVDSAAPVKCDNDNECTIIATIGRNLVQLTYPIHLPKSKEPIYIDSRLIQANISTNDNNNFLRSDSILNEQPVKLFNLTVSSAHEATKSAIKELNMKKMSLSSLKPCDFSQTFIADAQVDIDCLSSDCDVRNRKSRLWLVAFYTNDALCSGNYSGVYDNFSKYESKNKWQALFYPSNSTSPSSAIMYNVKNNTNKIIKNQSVSTTPKQLSQTTNAPINNETPLQQHIIKFLPTSEMHNEVLKNGEMVEMKTNMIIGGINPYSLKPEKKGCPNIGEKNDSLSHSVKLATMSSLTLVKSKNSASWLYLFYSDDRTFRMPWPLTKSEEKDTKSTAIPSEEGTNYQNLVYPYNQMNVERSSDEFFKNLVGLKKVRAIASYKLNGTINYVAIVSNKSVIEMVKCAAPCHKSTSIQMNDTILPDDITDWAPCQKIATFFSFINTLHSYNEDILQNHNKYSFTPNLKLPPLAVHADGNMFWFFTRYNSLTIMEANPAQCAYLDFTTRGVFKESLASSLFGQREPPFYVDDRIYNIDTGTWTPDLMASYVLEYPLDPSDKKTTKQTPRTTTNGSTSSDPITETTTGQSTATEKPNTTASPDTGSLVVLSIVAVVLAIVVVICAAACCLMSGARSDNIAGIKSYKSLRRRPEGEKSKKSLKSYKSTRSIKSTRKSLSQTPSPILKTKSTLSGGIKSARSKLSLTKVGTKSVRSQTSPDKTKSKNDKQKPIKSAKLKLSKSMIASPPATSIKSNKSIGGKKIIKTKSLPTIKASPSSASKSSASTPKSPSRSKSAPKLSPIKSKKS